MTVLAFGIPLVYLMTMAAGRTKNPEFAFCHPERASILSCPYPDESSSLLSSENDKYGSNHQFLHQTNEIPSSSPMLSLEFPSEASTSDLILLAHECDAIVFGTQDKDNPCHSPVSPFFQAATENEQMLLAMAKLGDAETSCTTASGTTSNHDFSRTNTTTSTITVSPSTTVATLLALNGLESAICRSTGHATGRAPLLKTMLSKLNEPNVATACRLLLLPQGLNLRNLLWHGFIEHLPRPWLALVLVLTKLLLTQQQLNVDVDCSTKISKGEKDDTVDPVDLQAVMDLRQFREFQNLLEVNTENKDDVLRHPPQSVATWLPQSHVPLWNLAVEWILEQRQPATLCALLSVLLEHSLRLDWCRFNNKPNGIIPRPGAYFVTLDGHGQRHVHDLLLYPYLIDNVQENQLLHHIDGSTIALLTDLFCSSCGGPNIRATVAHGLWDSLLLEEWTAAKSNATTGSPLPSSLLVKSRLWDMVRLILIAMEACASRRAICFRPVFSHAAVTTRNLEHAQAALQNLIYLQQNNQDYKTYWEISQNIFGNLPEEIMDIDLTMTDTAVQQKKFPLSCYNDMTQSKWNTQNVLDENCLNIKLSGMGATRTLLEDIAKAVNTHCYYLQEALAMLADDNISKRKRRRSLRIVHSSQLAKIFYTFALQVAIVSLEKVRVDGDDDDSLPLQIDKGVMLKAVERSRMVVSTMDNFLHEKVDRALKSVKEYTKGKAIKAIVIHLKQQQLCHNTLDN